MTALLVELEQAFAAEDAFPSGFPLSHLSPSSIDSFWKCAEAFRRERIAKLPTPTSDKMLFGTVFVRSAEVNWVQKIESHEDLTTKVMYDAAGDTFNTVLEEEKGKREIVWYDMKPAELQKGVQVAMVGSESIPAGYMQVVAPTVQPVTVERTFTVATESGVPLTGRIDVEDDRGRVIDVKTTGRSKTQTELDKDTQAWSYLFAREREGNPASSFDWHVVTRNKTKPGLNISLTRDGSTAKPDLFEGFVSMTVTTILRYLEDFGLDGPWPPAPPLSFLCSPRGCSFWGKGCPWRP